ncbi:threonine/serine dehydratase [Streptomyces somaliensis]|uniref:threonine ammonia-lyase n=1 Tax=Streptomyces somaliensis TaxID=78355 RepID=UPI0020CB9033|nr:threonine/serine dehydratase [Streptomyces somaliensis]MCP9946967.1 threonine/serine dehydratase [Streptomyces somaliensis]MCP9963605.1 threonine/serine dehydratase [Streptomyces somaliensis]MCP9972829.1 threonine/serine dehydratase [Streptomyces somaliensis]MCP9976067.1 threonine/serine dehydratase [Streptomyces somaliensis]
MTLVSPADLDRACADVAGRVVRTPLLPVPGTGHPFWLKPENLQTTGAFKIRGAHHRIASMTDAERARGVVTHSSGNHAQAVSWSARAFGTSAVVVMPDTATRVKVDATRALGARVLTTAPELYRDRAYELAAEHGYTLIPPFDDPHVIAGQGTVGREILEDLPGDLTVLVPVGGGGLVSGVAAAVKQSRPGSRVVGVEPALAGDAAESVRTGRLSRWTADRTGRTVADGLRTPSLGRLNWEHVRAYVDDVITVTEEEIRASARFLAARAHLVAEASGAVATAGHLFHGDRLPAELPRVAVVSGGNADPDWLAALWN